jgi:hypothetical protein
MAMSVRTIVGCERPLTLQSRGFAAHAARRPDAPAP